jgi:hypothetical protein
MPKSSHIDDDERKRRGTFRADRNDQVNFQDYADRKILPFPVLVDIPQPSLPLNDVGRMKYFEICETLKNSGRFVTFTRDIAESVGALWQTMHANMAAGKGISASTINQLRNLYDNLGVNESNTKVINGRGQGSKENPFATNGVAARHTPRTRPV